VVKDWTLRQMIWDEGYTAKHLKRRDLEELLALVEAQQVEVVIVCQLDRLTRSVAVNGEPVERSERAECAERSR
jgi:DNA invertase Pin-like site-specific DNA recombinase